MTYHAEILADSISPDGVRLVTFLTRYPRMIHAEMLRHRMFAHSVASSRAIPTEKLIEQVLTDPFVPEFNRRVKGMGVGQPLDRVTQKVAQQRWRYAAEDSARNAQLLLDMVVDKSRVNRLLEPYMWVTDIITATEWKNFFALRQPSNDDPVPQIDFPSQPEFQIIARMMRDAMRASTPREMRTWHLPLVKDQELIDDLGYVSGVSFGLSGKEREEVILRWAKISAARIARVSYQMQDQYEPVEKSLERFDQLAKDGHWSPLEHVARPMSSSDYQYLAEHLFDTSSAIGRSFCGHLRGWVCLRKEPPYNEFEYNRALMIEKDPKVETR
jgi:hypothetical protein